MQALTTDELALVFKHRAGRDYFAPNLASVDWGVLDYFGWIHPAGHLGYVAMPQGDCVMGLTLRRMVNHGARPRTHMCSWCHHVYRSRGTAMFSAQVAGSEGRRSIGNYICQNLDCSLRIRNLASDPPTYLPETIDLERKITRLKIAVNGFIARANPRSQTTY